MNYSFLISSKAEHEITNAFLWYKDIGNNLEDTFEKFIRQIFIEIQNYPHSFQIRYLNVRIAFLYRFPYGVHYLIDDNKIIIIGVYHTSSNPVNWL